MAQRTVRVLLALALVTVAHLWVPQPTVACSCMMPEAEPIRAASVDPQVAIFTGIVGAPEALATPVRVTRWFQGAAPAEIVGLDDAAFVDGAACGTSRPPAGSEWLFVAGMNERGLYGVGLCTTHGDLGTVEGQRLLEEAIDVFGDPAPLPSAAPTPTGPLSGPIVSTLVPVALVVLFGIGLVAGVLLVLARREERSG